MRSELQGVQFAPHSPAQRIINQLVLFDTCQPGELRRRNLGGPMIIVARQIAHFHDCAGKRFFDQRDDVVCGHGHYIQP